MASLKIEQICEYEHVNMRHHQASFYEGFAVDKINQNETLVICW